MTNAEEEVTNVEGGLAEVVFMTGMITESSDLNRVDFRNLKSILVIKKCMQIQSPLKISINLKSKTTKMNDNNKANTVKEINKHLKTEAHEMNPNI